MLQEAVQSVAVDSESTSDLLLLLATAARKMVYSVSNQSINFSITYLDPGPVNCLIISPEVLVCVPGKYRQQCDIIVKQILDLMNN